MKRADQDTGDSLELMLDTICNMFGTIIFVALIAALLALTSAKHKVSTDLSDLKSQRDRQVAALRVRAAELDAELEKLPASEEVIADEQQVSRAEQAIAEIARRRELVKQYTEALASSRANSEVASAQVEPLRKEIKRLDESIAAAKRAQHRKMRTPLERELGLTTFTVVVWQSRLYAICDWSHRPPNRCEWFRLWNPSFVNPARCGTPRFRCDSSGIQIQRVVELRPESGIPIGNLSALESDPRFQQILGMLDSKEDLIGFSVATDSFESFAVAKEAFLRAGFNYNLDVNEDPLPRYSDSWIQGISRGL